MADQDTAKDSVKDDSGKVDSDKSQPVPINTESSKKNEAPISAEPPKADVPSPSVPVPPGPSVGQGAGESLITETAADATPSANAPVSSAPAEPVVVSNNDLPAQGGENTEKLAEEIEVLTGEIQALEAKIERLTSSASTAPADGPVAPISADVPPINQSEPIGQTVVDKPAPMPDEKPVPSASAQPPAGTENEFVNKPKTSPGASAVGKVDDISPKSASMPEPMPQPVKEESTNSSGSGMEVIAEVVAVFGIIIFIVLAISPFFRELLGEDTFLAIQQIGWLTTLGTVGLGFLLMLFVRGKAMFKILLFLLLVITAVVFLAMNNSSLVSPLSGIIDPFLDFYR